MGGYHVATLAQTKGNPNKNVISESGLYKLIMRSDKPQAREFQDWVTRVVLPAIRKDGMYVDALRLLDSDEIKIQKVDKNRAEGSRFPRF
ncbi:MAG: hypothetical protein JJU21_08480 [Salinarimonas sp.]|nr:hypothetical protein [Salinarimonas sp.]